MAPQNSSVLVLLITLFSTFFALAAGNEAKNCLDIIHEGCLTEISKFLNKKWGCYITSAFGPMESRCLTPGKFMFNKAITKHGKPLEPIRSICPGKVARIGNFLHQKKEFSIVTRHDFTETCMFNGKEHETFEIYYGNADGGETPSKGQSVEAGEVIANLSNCNQCKGKEEEESFILLLLLKIGGTFVNPIALFPSSGKDLYNGAQLRYVHNNDKGDSGFELTSSVRCYALSVNRYEIKCGEKEYLIDFNLREGFSSEVDNPPPHTLDTSKPYFIPFRNPPRWAAWYNSKMFLPESWLGGEKCCDVTIKDVWGEARWSGSRCTNGLAPIWKSVGSEIVDVESDLWVRTVALSQDGRVMAIISTGQYHSNPKKEKGKVRVYSLGEGKKKWIQMGQTFVIDETEFAIVGKTVSLSASGNVMAFSNYQHGGGIGRVRAFSFDTKSTSWVQMGEDIKGSKSYAMFGYTVALSNDGLTLGEFSMSPPGSSAFRVRIHKFIDSKWEKVGKDVAHRDTKAGYGSFSLSGDGKTFAVGHTRSFTRVYSLSSDGASWSQLGQSFKGSSVENSYFGSDIALSENGKIVAVAYMTSQFSKGPEGVEVFYLEGNKWKRMGQVLNGLKLGDGFGNKLDLSDNGKMLLVGDKFGSVRAFTFKENSWVSKGEDIVGAGRGEMGRTLSGNGRTIATFQENSVKVFMNK